MLPLFVPLLSLIAGILLSPFLATSYVWWCLPFAAVIALCRPRYAFLFILLSGSALRSLEPEVPPLPPAEAGRVVGVLLRKPEWRGLGVYVDLRIETIDGREYSGRARLTEFLDDPQLRELFDAHDLATGDRVEIVVKLQRPVRYRNPGVFDFRRHLERQGVYWTGTIRNPRLITVLSRGWQGWHYLDGFHQNVHNRLARHFQEDPVTRGLVLGMVLGRKHELTASVEKQFQSGGLYHLVVVSGFNIAVVAMAASFFARLIAGGRRSRMMVVLLCVLIYAGIAGAEAPVLRATLMAGLLIAARVLDRTAPALHSLLLAALVLLLVDPVAIEDASFQMTFAATAAVICLGIPATRWLLGGLEQKLAGFGNTARDGWLRPDIADWRLARRMWCERHGLPHAVITIPWRITLLCGQALLISVSVEAVLLYFLVESFHSLSPVAPLLNVPAGFLAALITPLGLALLLVPDSLAAPIVWALQALCHTMMWLLEYTLSLPGAHLRVPSAPLPLWLAYGGAVAAGLYGLVTRKKPWAVGWVLAAALQIAIVLGSHEPAPPDVITITFLDVGQGDSALVEFPDSRRILIDGGGVAAGRFLGLQDQSTFSIGENVVSAYLFSRGIRKLDAVVLSHAHNDHLDGLKDVLDNFEVAELWIGRNPMIPAYRELIERSQERGTALRTVAAGDRIGEWEVLHPPRHWTVRAAASNNDSLVLLLRSGQQTALFPGDLELPLPSPVSVDVLKVAHHGSRGVRMRTLSPVRVISVGANNPFGHPAASSLPALRTDVLGAITVRLASPRPEVLLLE
jgi:competence protein ComEC